MLTILIKLHFGGIKKVKGEFLKFSEFLTISSVSICLISFHTIPFRLIEIRENLRETCSNVTLQEKEALLLKFYAFFSLRKITTFTTKRKQ